MVNNQSHIIGNERQLPRLILLFMAVDWSIYMRRPAVFALAEAAKKYGTTVVAINRPLCPFTTMLRKLDRFSELFGKPKLDSLTDNLYVYSPRYFIHDHIANCIPSLQSLNCIALRHSLKYLQKKLGIYEPKPIVMFNYPQQGYVVDLYKNSFSVYELYDELCGIDGQVNPKTLSMEKALHDKVNLLLTTSHALNDKYGPNYPNSIMYGNGLSRDAYNRLSSHSTVIPEITADIPSPRIGYVGMLSERMNWQLITALAKSSPSWQFVFIGPTSDKKIIHYCQELDNVHILGPIAQNIVPDVLRSLDVGIMPYCDTPFFYYLNALKFYEMAATGLPMVSSPVAEMQRYPDSIISVIENKVELWKIAIAKGLTADRTEVTKIGREIASQFIWEEMADRLLEKIVELN